MNEEVSTFDYEEENPKGSNRPAFLKVLCILSWISVALGVFGCLSNSLTPFSDSMDILDDQISMMEEIDAPGLEDFGYFLQAKKDNFKLENTGNFILILIEGFAVYLMFMLKKIGFWVYTGTQIGFIMLMTLIYPISNMFTILTLIIYLFLIVLFVILYALNLKHMN